MLYSPTLSQFVVEVPLRFVRRRRISAERVLLFCGLSLLWFVLCRALSNEWSANEQYSYGWFVPFFAAFLFWLRWEDRPKESEIRGQKSEVRNIIAGVIAMSALFILLPVRLFEIANPDWRPLSWLHAGAVVALTMLAIWSLGGMRLLRHFAFPVAFILVAVPWVTPI